MKYGARDKVVVEISGITNTPYGEHTAFVCNNSHYLPDKAILGKLEDFQPAKKKIKMTIGEKKEFDRLMHISTELYTCLSRIATYNSSYPLLYKRLFDNDALDNKKAQVEFSRAWGKPSMIEVGEKKYYVHLFKSQEIGYLNQLRGSVKLIISSNSETDLCKAKFTEDEIENLKDLGFKITEDALEEV